MRLLNFIIGAAEAIMYIIAIAAMYLIPLWIFAQILGRACK